MGRDGLTRRSIVTAGGGAMVAAAGAALMASAGLAQDAPPPLVIGVLMDKSGIGASVSGPPLAQAVRMAVQDTGLLPDGRPLSVVEDSFQLKPDDALAIARRWFDQGVSAIVDVPGATAALAVQALARSRGRTALFTGSSSPALTGRACSPFGSSWTVDSASMTTAMVRAMARSGAKTWFLVVPDTVLGLAVQTDALRAIEDSGGQVVGRSRHPAEATDFSSIVVQAKESGAAAVGLCDITEGLTAQLGQYQDGGLFGEGRSIAAFFPAITDIHAAGAKAAKGLLLARPFYWNQNEQARSFSNRFIAVSGQMPDEAHAAAYVAVRQYLRAVVATEGLDVVRINEEMRRVPVYFFGRPARLRLDGRLSADLSLLRVKPPEAMRGEWDHYEQIGIIPKSDIYRPMRRTGCRMAL